MSPRLSLQFDRQLRRREIVPDTPSALCWIREKASDQGRGKLSEIFNN
jgi:hypothetical protein